MTAAQENYTRWLAAEIQAAIDDPRPSMSINVPFLPANSVSFYQPCRCQA